MKSFPSSFTKNSLVQEGLASTNIKQTLKNMGGAIMNNTLSGGNSNNNDARNKEELGEKLKLLGAWKEFNYNESLSNIGITSGNNNLQDNTFRLYNHTSDAPIYENANKIPALILASINKYRRVYSISAIQYGSPTKLSKEKGAKTVNEAYQEIVSPSLFNPWFGIRSQGFTINTPLMYLKDGENTTQVSITEEDGDKEKIGDSKQITLANYADFTDCSIKTLVNLYKNGESKMGSGAFYRYADFMYCKELGKISNNHLITLRKFTHPIGDNIFSNPNLTKLEGQLMPDKGRLVTWFGTEDNKLEDICKFSFGTTWKELNAEIEDIHSKEDNPKVLPSLINLANPNYRAGAANGLWGNNSLYNWVEGHVSILGYHPFQAESAEASDNDRYYMDKNKVWTPKDTIQSTHIYEGKIQFQHSFTLTFNYELRSYDGINPKTAFLDLMGNILEVTHRRGDFWGGKRRWLGAPRNEQGWKTANKLFSKLEQGAHDGLDALFGCSSFEDLASLCSDALKSIGGLINEVYEKAKNYVTSGNFKSDAQKAGHAAIGTLTGMLKNKLGRPAVYAMNSLLKDENVGLWHVTIGNPRNPIMTIGNLILENSELQQYGVLGIDDFPVGLKLTVTLKHAKPRDITTIASMYTCGQGGLLLPLNGRDYKKYVDLDNEEDILEYGFGKKTKGDIDGTNLQSLQAEYDKEVEEASKEILTPEQIKERQAALKQAADEEQKYYNSLDEKGKADYNEAKEFERNMKEFKRRINKPEGSLIDTMWVN